MNFFPEFNIRVFFPPSLKSANDVWGKTQGTVGIKAALKIDSA